MFLHCVFNSIAFFAQAQQNPMRYGRIDPQDVRMTGYEADPSVNALILGDFGVVEIRYNNESGWEYMYTRHLRVKIFNKDAFGSANFKIYLHSSEKGGKEKLNTLKGTVYTPPKKER